MPSITPFLWFDDQAEQAAAFYVSIFPNSKIITTSYYGDNMPAPAGTAMVVDFELNGQRFNALNGGPALTFSPAISFVITCKTQTEIDHYWQHLSADPASEQCGWLKDKFGLSWQVVPSALGTLMSDPDSTKSARVMAAMLTMKKIILTDLEKAYHQL